MIFMMRNAHDENLLIWTIVTQKDKVLAVLFVLHTVVHKELSTQYLVVGTQLILMMNTVNQKIEIGS
jgi:hypothetical protein